MEQRQMFRKFDITMFTWERNEKLYGSWNMQHDLYERETIERMIGHFQEC